MWNCGKCIFPRWILDDYPYTLSSTYISLNCSARLSQINLIFAWFFSHCQCASDKYHKANILFFKYFDSKGAAQIFNPKCYQLPMPEFKFWIDIPYYYTQQHQDKHVLYSLWHFLIFHYTLLYKSVWWRFDSDREIYNWFMVMVMDILIWPNKLLKLPHLTSKQSHQIVRNNVIIQK